MSLPLTTGNFGNRIHLEFSQRKNCNLLAVFNTLFIVETHSFANILHNFVKFSSLSENIGPYVAGAPVIIVTINFTFYQHN